MRALKRILAAEGLLKYSSLKVKEWEGREGDRSHLTREETGQVRLLSVIPIRGSRGERRDWHEQGGQMWFGNYPKEKWLAFLEDIKKNGMREPIFIIKDPGKPPLIHEGNHRVQAARQLGMRYVPVEVRYFGHSEREGLVFPDEV